MAVPLASERIARILALLIEADHSGRPPLPKGLPKEMRQVLRIAEEAGITNGPPPRLIKGRDVLPYFHGNAGPHIGRAVAATHEAFLKGRIDTVDDARIWLKKYVESEARLVRGSDVLAHMAKPGPGVRKVLQAAWDAQLAGAFCDDEGAKEWLEKYFEAGHADTI